METPQNDSTGCLNTVYGIFAQGRFLCQNNRLLIVGLRLLNGILLIAAIVIGINCAGVKHGSLHRSHSAAVQLINELEYLHSNHSNVISAEEEARKGSCDKCLLGWIVFNSSCYYFSYVASAPARKNWPDSRADCIGRGADLVVIDNQEEQTFLSSTIENVERGQYVYDTGFWVGPTDEKTEGTWVWINNVTEVEQKYWMDGEPDIGYLGEDCGVIVYNNPWKTRYDDHCEHKMRYWICETPPRQT